MLNTSQFLPMVNSGSIKEENITQLLSKDITMNYLPDELILYIIQFLEDTDIWSLSFTCKRFFFLSTDKNVWEKLCKKCFNCQANCSNDRFTIPWGQHYKIVRFSYEAPQDNWETNSPIHNEIILSPSIPRYITLPNGTNDTLSARKIRCLLEHGINVDAKNRYGDTPLHTAAAKGRSYLIGILLEYGADINAINFAFDTPLHFAARSGKYETCKILLENGANLYAGSPDSPLHWAAKEGHLAVARLLINFGCNINVTNDRKETPLHWAAKFGQIPFAVWLVEAHSADIYAKDVMGACARFTASSRGFLELANHLQAKRNSLQLS